MTRAAQWSYEMLKKIYLDGASVSDLEYLKNIFSNEIGSNRRKDRIRTIEDLMDCLERNDVINDENVEPFRKLGSSNMKLQAALDNYSQSEGHRELSNCYREQRLADEIQQRLHISIAPTQITAVQQNYLTVAVFTEVKRTAVYSKISQELGRSWRDLGRKLGIGEGAMDEVETRFPHDLRSRILHVLQLFEEDECNDPRQVLLLLCQGLSDCGRKDLRRKVEQIMSH